MKESHLTSSALLLEALKDSSRSMFKHVTKLTKKKLAIGAVKNAVVKAL